MKSEFSDSENVKIEAPVAREKQTQRLRLHKGQLVDWVRVELGIQDFGAEFWAPHLELEGLRNFEVSFEKHQFATRHMVPAFFDRSCYQPRVDAPQASEVFLLRSFLTAHVGCDGELLGFLHELTHEPLFCKAVNPGFSMRDTNHVVGAFVTVFGLEIDELPVSGLHADRREVVHGVDVEERVPEHELVPSFVFPLNWSRTVTVAVQLAVPLVL